MSKLEIQNKDVIRKRLATVKKHSSDLQPIGEKLRKNALDYNQERAVHGIDARGTTLAPLKPSTLARRRGSGPPLAPNYTNSGIVTECKVEVEYAPGVVIIKKSWPGLRWLKFAIEGNENMAARDPTGYSRSEVQAFGAIVKAHVTQK